LRKGREKRLERRKGKGIDEEEVKSDGREGGE
jgi:hypothetical protein